MKFRLVVTVLPEAIVVFLIIVLIRVVGTLLLPSVLLTSHVIEPLLVLWWPLNDALEKTFLNFIKLMFLKLVFNETKVLIRFRITIR